MSYEDKKGTKMRLEADVRLIEILQRYNICNLEAGQDYAQYLKEKRNKIENEYFYIPVLGVQGAGKSTLLNALLMDDIVLPVDADETTCIPVEVHYGEQQDIYVHFEKQSPIKCSIKEIEQYVHNTYNPGNEKGVSHIVVYMPHELLKNNVVLVDLPGVGSLTQANAKATMAYVEKLSAAIFLLRTTPPMTRSETLFVKSVWHKLSKVWFVQNQWNDESLQEVEDGKEFNESILRNLASEIKVPLENDIMIVNNYEALRGKLEEDDRRIKASGIDELKDVIIKAGQNWKTILTEDFESSLVLLAKEARTQIQRKLSDKGLSKKEILKKQREMKRMVEAELEENQSHMEAIREKIKGYKEALVDYAKDQEIRQASNLRTEMRSVIRSGVVDGELINRAFQDHQNQISQEVMEDLLLKLEEVQVELSGELEAIQLINPQGNGMKYEDFYKKSGFKAEKALPAIGNILGALGGYALLAAMTGPLGIVAGFGVTLVGGWIGQKAKKAVSNQRQKTTIEEIEAPICEFVKNMSRHIIETANMQLGQIEEALEAFERRQQEILDEDYNRQRSVLKGQEAEVECTEAMLAEDINYINQLVGEMNV